MMLHASNREDGGANVSRVDDEGSMVRPADDIFPPSKHVVPVVVHDH